MKKFIVVFFILLPTISFAASNDPLAIIKAQLAAQQKQIQSLLNPTAAATTAPAAASNPTDVLNQILSDIENIQAPFINGVIEGLQEADKDAATVVNASSVPPTVNDPISHACYPAQVQFLQSLPAASLITTPAPYNLIVLFQRKRDFIHLIQAGLPSYLQIGCAALLGDEIKTLVSTLNLVGINVAAASITGLFPPLAPLTMPALSIPGL